MDDNPNLPLEPRHPPTPPRRFGYRAVEQDTNLAHPLRRATDTPRSFQAVPGQARTNPLLLKFRVYLKLN
jgi:hypothetical protein